MFGIMPAAKCPTATLDVALNLKNRQKCIKVAMYGPANPRQPNLMYWQKLANIGGIGVAEAKTMRCGNCAAFDIKKQTIDCIKLGLGRDGIDPQDTVVAAELGYCRMFQFKCAASRTCSAWITGGPIR